MNIERLSRFRQLVSDRIELEKCLVQMNRDDPAMADIWEAIGRLTAEMELILDFIYSLPPSSGRYGLVCRCLYGMSWEDIAISAMEYDRKMASAVGVECRKPRQPESFRIDACRAIRRANNNPKS